MNLLEKTDDEILEIAEPLWGDLVESSNKRDYLGFIKHFSKEMLMGANEIEIGKQCFRRQMCCILTFRMRQTHKSMVITGLQGT